MKNIKFNYREMHIHITQKAYEQILQFTPPTTNNEENGGILMGELHPSVNTIIITHIICSKNHLSDRYSINLNVKNLQQEMDKIWQKSNGKITYLGDWHTHYENYPNPSSTDYITFVKNYYLSKFDQNILVYIILGTKDIWCNIFNGYRFYKKNLK